MPCNSFVTLSAFKTHVAGLIIPFPMLYLDIWLSFMHLRQKIFVICYSCRNKLSCTNLNVITTNYKTRSRIVAIYSIYSHSFKIGIPWLCKIYFPFCEVNYTDEMSLVISSSNYVTYFHSHHHCQRGISTLHTY